MSFTDEEIARIAHEANRALQQVLGDEQVSPPWDQASQHDKDVSAAGAQVGRHGATPEALHEKWMNEKLAAGWTRSDVKDAEAKTHPLLVPFDQLPPGDQAKDYLFAGICTAMNQAADVKARAENEQLRLRETAEMLARTGGNQAAPFGGAAPVIVDLAATGPRPPEKAQEG